MARVWSSASWLLWIALGLVGGCKPVSDQDLPTQPPLSTPTGAPTPEQTPTPPPEGSASPTEVGSASPDTPTPTDATGEPPSGTEVVEPTGAQTDAPDTPTPEATEVPTATAVPTPTTDQDNDGVPLAEDCNDLNPDAYPGAPEACDAGADLNCDSYPSVGTVQDWYDDVDRDGYGNSQSEPYPGCEPPQGGNFVAGEHSDCNDEDAQVNPGRPEICGDGKDNDCNEATDEDRDEDADGYSEVCGDCDDADDRASPWHTFETRGDEIDNDCDGSTDEDEVVSSASATFYGGSDMSWFGGNLLSLGDFDGDGFNDWAIGASQDDPSVGGSVTVIYGDGNRLRQDVSGLDIGVLLGDDSIAGAGSSLAVGYFDNDEYPDLAIGQPGAATFGKVSVIYGGPFRVLGEKKIQEYRDVEFRGPPFSTLGWSSALVDLDGDSLDDLVMGANFINTVVIAWGDEDKQTGTIDADDLQEVETHVRGSLGWTAAGVGDLNDDGYQDVVVGAPKYTAEIQGDDAPNAGAVIFVWGDPVRAEVGSDGNVGVIHGSAAEQALGSHVRPAGDVVGDDGFSDVLMGAPGYGANNQGAVFVMNGNVGLFTNESSVERIPTRIICNTQSCGMGNLTTSASAGDVNRDGYDDLLVGAAGYKDANTAPGAIGLFFGSPGGLPPQEIEVGGADALFRGISDGDGLSGCALLGDIDDDNYDDLLISAFLAHNGKGTQFGAAYVYYGY